MVEKQVAEMDLDSDDELSLGTESIIGSQSSTGRSMQEAVEQIKINRKNLVDIKEIPDNEIKKHYSFKDKLGEGSFGKVYLA